MSLGVPSKTAVVGRQSVQLRVFVEYRPPILPLPRLSEFQSWFLASSLLLCCATDASAMMEEHRGVFPYSKCSRITVFTVLSVTQCPFSFPCHSFSPMPQPELMSLAPLVYFLSGYRADWCH